MGFWIRTGVIVLEVSCHVVIQIVGLTLVAEAVCVCEQKPRFVISILTLNVIIVEIIHEHFRKVQHYESSVHGFILDDYLFGKLNHDEIVVYIGKIFNSGCC